MNDASFNTPKKPECGMISQLHGRHDGYISFHYKDKAGNFRPLVSLPADSLPGLFDQMIPDLEVDSYFTVHGMCARRRLRKNSRGYLDTSGNVLPNAWRERDGVRWLTSNFVDLDCKKLGMEAGTVIGEVIRMQDAGRIPPATIITRSGNGVWLFWKLIDDQGNHLRGHDSTIVKWSRVQNAIVGRFSRFGADANAKDAARVTRIPGSINSKAGLRVSYWPQLNANGEPFTYTLADLANWFGASLELKRRHRLPGIARTVYQERASKGQRGRWQKCLKNFELLWELRDKFREGTRNAAVMVLATVLHLSSKSLGFTPDAIAKELNDLFDDLDQPHDGKPYTREEFEATVERASRQNLVPPEQRYISNQQICDLLQVTLAESKVLCGWKPATAFISPEEVSALPPPKMKRGEVQKLRRKILVAELDRRGIKPKQASPDLPSLEELADLVDDFGLPKPTVTTIGKDLDEMGFVNPRKRRPKKPDTSRRLFE